MKILQAVIMSAIVAFIAFGVGYLSGSVKIAELHKEIQVLKGNLEKSNFQYSLSSLKQGLYQANIDLLKKNFGQANEKIASVENSLYKITADLPAPQKSKFAPLFNELKTISGDIANLNLEALNKIDALINKIDLLK